MDKIFIYVIEFQLSAVKLSTFWLLRFYGQVTNQNARIAIDNVCAILNKIQAAFTQTRFSIKRFHDLETASKTTLRKPANFMLDHF